MKGTIFEVGERYKGKYSTSVVFIRKVGKNVAYGVERKCNGELNERIIPVELWDRWEKV